MNRPRQSSLGNAHVVAVTGEIRPQCPSNKAMCTSSATALKASRRGPRTWYKMSSHRPKSERHPGLSSGGVAHISPSAFPIFPAFQESIVFQYDCSVRHCQAQLARSAGAHSDRGNWMGRLQRLSKAGRQEVQYHGHQPRRHKPIYTITGM